LKWCGDALGDAVRALLLSQLKATSWAIFKNQSDSVEFECKSTFSKNNDCPPLTRQANGGLGIRACVPISVADFWLGSAP
jgi:hypothetical protein